MKITNLRIYYLIVSSNNLWFITSSWLFYWLKFMSIKDVGLIDSLAFFIGIMFEFPSGIISDKFGRKITLIFSQALQFIGSLIITLATSGFEIGLGFIIFQLGVSLFSGTIESFGYESSVSENENYEKTLIKSSSLSTTSYLISLLIGGYLYTVNNNYPNILWTLNYLFGFLISFFIIKSFKAASVNETFNVKNIASKMDIKVILYLLFFLSVCFAFDYGFLKLVILDKFSDYSNNYFYIVIASLLGIALSNFLLKKDLNLLNSLRTGYFSLCLLFLFTFVSKQLNIVVFFLFSFFVIYSNQLFLKYINQRISDNERAGVISFFSFLFKFPYVLLALYFGMSLQTEDTSMLFWYLGLSMLVLYLGVKFASKLRYNSLFEKGA